MNLYTTGCSHTHGTEDTLGPNYREQNWAARLFKMFAGRDEVAFRIPNSIKNSINITLVGDSIWFDNSVPGSNNASIVSRIVNDICGRQIRPDHAVIQFTHPTRFWTPLNSSYGDVQITIGDPYTFGTMHQPNGKHATNKSEDDHRHGTNPLNSRTFHDKAFYDEYFKGPAAQRTATLHMFSEIKLVETLLKSLNIPHTFIIWPRVYSTCYTAVESAIDHSRILNYDDGIYYEMDKLMPTYGYKFPSYSLHYFPDGHQFIAESVYNHILSGKKLVPNGTIESSETFVDSVY